MSESKHTPEHWAGETTSYRPSREAREMWALVYDATPGGVRNDDGTTTYSARIPALIISEYVANPEKTAAELAAKMNTFPVLVDALPDLSCVITWLENGCDPLKARDELAIYKARIDAAKAKAEGHS